MENIEINVEYRQKDLDIVKNILFTEMVVKRAIYLS